ncbi:MAG: hypothetical protein WCL71_09905 [Deltaproteobacteria bacterium]
MKKISGQQELGIFGDGAFLKGQLLELRRCPSMLDGHANQVAVGVKIEINVFADSLVSVTELTAHSIKAV